MARKPRPARAGAAMTTPRNREDWLHTVAKGMEPWFAELGHPLPKYRVAIGFPGTGRRGKRIGECWDAKHSADGNFEILIRPDRDDEIEVAAILAHEMVHAAVGTEAGHGPGFRKVATAIGLMGQMRSTTPDDAFKRRVTPILKRVGDFPHAALDFCQGRTKQSTRLLKVICPDCGYTVRVAKKWLVERGAPICSCNLKPMILN